MKKISFIFLPILFFSYIAVETYLKLNHSSLCATSGCQLAGALLRFDSIYLNYIGMVSAIAMIVVGILSYREIVSEKLFFLVVGASLLFETIMLGYQFYASPEMCIFCMGVYAFLIAILLSASPKYFAITAMGAVSVFTSLSFLSVPSAEPYLNENGNYLIQSKSCKHCKKVKSYMRAHDINFTKIDINDVEAQNFATFLNFKTIPILLIKDGSNIKIINGDTDIIDSFETPTEMPTQVEERESSKIDNATISSSDIFGSSEKENEGCGFATLNDIEPECDK